MMKILILTASLATQVSLAAEVTAKFAQYRCMDDAGQVFTLDVKKTSHGYTEYFYSATLSPSLVEVRPTSFYGYKDVRLTSVPGGIGKSDCRKLNESDSPVPYSGPRHATHYYCSNARTYPFTLVMGEKNVVPRYDYWSALYAGTFRVSTQELADTITISFEALGGSDAEWSSCKQGDLTDL